MLEGFGRTRIHCRIFFFPLLTQILVKTFIIGYLSLSPVFKNLCFKDWNFVRVKTHPLFVLRCVTLLSAIWFSSSFKLPLCLRHPRLTDSLVFRVSKLSTRPRTFYPYSSDLSFSKIYQTWDLLVPSHRRSSNRTDLTVTQFPNLLYPDFLFVLPFVFPKIMWKSVKENPLPFGPLAASSSIFWVWKVRMK